MKTKTTLLGALFGLILALAFTPGAQANTAQSGPIFMVNTTNEHSDQLCGTQDCSLWDAANAAGAYFVNTGQRATITFASNVVGTITTALQASGIGISHPVKIAGPGAGVLTISGNGVSRVFNIAASSASNNIEISDLTIADGKVSGSGGGILNAGELSLNRCILSNNRSTDNGGGLSNGGTVTLTDVTVTGNVTFAGGGIFNNGSLTLTNVTLNDNHASGGFGGGISHTGGATTLTNVTLSGNSAYDGGAIYTAGALQLTNVTIAGNSGATTGGILQVSNGMVIDIKNTLIAKGTTGDNCHLTGYSPGGISLMTLPAISAVRATRLCGTAS